MNNSHSHMTDEDDHPNSKKGIDDQYPLDSNCYQIIAEIGRGESSVVYKAICIPMDSSVVAIKVIDLRKSKDGEFADVPREATMTALRINHPNILRAHCSFTVKNSLWVVMPFMCTLSLQLIHLVVDLDKKLEKLEHACFEFESLFDEIDNIIKI